MSSNRSEMPGPLCRSSSTITELSGSSSDGFPGPLGRPSDETAPPPQTTSNGGLSGSAYDAKFSWKAPRDIDLSPGLRLRTKRIRKHLPAGAAAARVLDVGSGSAPQAMAFGFETPLFLDISFFQMRRLSETGLACSVAHAEALPFASGSFDYVFCTEVLEHIEGDRRCLAEIHRILKKDGWLVLSVPHRTDYFGVADTEAGHLRRYELPRLTEMLSSSFKVESVFPIWGRRWNRLENYVSKLGLASPILQGYAKTPSFLMYPLSLFGYLLMKIDLHLTEPEDASSVGLLCKKAGVAP
ncbi:MAG: class I SAM-dependent methyltransferase [Candidatus Eisenbacteria bacterium]